MKKQLFAILLIVCMLVSLVACNPDETPVDTDKTTTTTSGTETNGDDPGDVNDPITDGTTDGGADATTGDGSDATTGGDNAGTTVGDNNAGTTAGGDNAGTTVGGNNVGTTAGGNKTTTAGGNKTTAGGNKTTTKTTTTTKKGGAAVAAMDDKLDFKGAEIRKTIIGVISPEIQRRAAAFEKEYNCKFTFVKLKHDSYNSSIASSIAAKDPYDIGGIAPHYFPEAVVSNLYEPLDDVYTTADVYGHKDNTKGGGLDLKLMDTYKMNGHYYGVASHTGSYSSDPYVLLYNKKMMKAAGYTGSKDPMQMYIDGKWTWDTFEDMANAIQKTAKEGTFVLGGSMFPACQFMVYSNNVSLTKTVNGKVTQNLTDAKFLTALNRIQKWFTSKTPFIDVAKGYSDSNTDFLNGVYYMQPHSAISAIVNAMPMVQKSAAFDKDISNMGLVPFPVGPDNKNRVVASVGVYAKSTALGGDKRASVAWVKYYDYFEDPMDKQNPYKYDAETQAIIDSLYDNLILPVVNYKSGGTATAETIFESIVAEARSGNDISQAISSSTATFQDCIDKALKQK